MKGPMKRRREEFHVGSDSFLDVVANIVGITIILIVLVGVRVRNTPPDAARVAERRAESAKRAREDWERDRARIEAENEKRIADHAAALAEREAALANRSRRRAETEKARDELEAKRQRREAEIAQRLALLRRFEDEAAAMAAEIERLGGQVEETQAAIESGRAEQEQVRAELATRESDVRALERQVAARSSALARTKGTWQEVAREVGELKTRLAKMEAKKYVKKTWVHYATPLARRVQREEIHFRCLGDRVADTHLDSLIDRIKQEVYRRQGHIPSIYTDVVGPIAGFSLKYTLVRTGASVSEQLNNPFTYQVQVASWELIGESDLIGETQSQALSPGSDFQASIAVHGPDTHAVTLWVYPDSFTIAKAIESALHQRGYTVALRPLPRHIPIAGSPFGSASRGQ